ncbi:uncharacterized protein [Amphiura filiformis]|uniref:uncharacterized protein isoform X3 n=1 Tax=Amphiura filiformis TaxID=82378 RepID=UPI003B21E692
MLFTRLRGVLHIYSAFPRFFRFSKANFVKRNSSSHQLSQVAMATKHTMVLDTDVGVDDAVALLMALSQPRVDLIGVTCVHGNTSLDNVMVNTLRVLKVGNRLEIPVFKGASSPLIGQDATGDSHYHHGNDGMGGVPDPDPPSRDLIQSEHAVNALIRLANEHPGEISLVAIGPLTNLALATKMDPEFSKNLKELVIMGGNVEGRGNKWPGAEYNFRMDPEAAQIVLHEYQCNIMIMPLESCRNNALTWEFHDKWLSTDTVKGRFLHDILKHATHHSRVIRKKPLSIICDASAMAVAVDRSMITDMIKAHVTIELNGQNTRGQMVQVNTGWRDVLPGEGREVDIVLKYDKDVMMNMLMKTVE